MTITQLSAAIVVLGAALAGAQEPYGLDTRVPNTSFHVHSAGYTLADMELRRVFSGSRFTRPVYLTHAGDGSGRVFVVEQPGTIRVLAEGLDQTFLDLRGKVNDGPNEAGLLGLAFHPHYAENGRFYVYYTYGNLFSRFSVFRVSADPDAADPASERVLFEVQQPAGNHNGGQLAFGPDGYLYIGLGDGGGADDQYRNGQNRKDLLGDILRIDVDHTQGELAYAIPADNPLVGNGEGWREEVWAWGLRNPWRFSFDRLTGHLWVGDVGQNKWEEVDLVEKGGNYGWNTMEGFHCFSPAVNCDTTGLKLPVVEYSHDEGKSISGGFVYRGARLIGLVGVYVYGDYVSQQIWGLRYAQGQVTEHRLLALSPSPIASFGEDEAGEVYVLGLDGRIYTFEERDPAAPAGQVPELLSKSGVFSDMKSQTPAPGLIPYGVNSQLWSDGAYKTRLLALPDTTQIGFSPEGNWSFPPGAVLVKNFYLDLEQGKAQSRRIVETRFLVKRDQGEEWDGFSYQWNEAGTEATLLAGSATQRFTVIDPAAPGGAYEHEHYFPSRAECNICHTEAAGHVLGVRTAQLNGTYNYGAVRDNQLRTLNHLRLFNEDIGQVQGSWPRLPDPLVAGQSLEVRARAYLDANCSHCHRPEGTGRGGLDLRFGTPLAATHLIDAPPEVGDLGVKGARLIRSGAPDSSVLYLRLLDLGRFRMPPLASHRVDQEGAALLRQWIEALGQPTAVEAEENAVPAAFVLQPNYPNPFNGSTLIRFALATPARVRLEVFDLLGRRVALLAEGRREAGQYEAVFASDALANGVYLCRLTGGTWSQTRKMVLTK